MRAEVDGNETEPDDAGRVHGKADVFRLIEILRNLASLNRVHGADYDQQHVVGERQHEPLVLPMCALSHCSSVVHKTTSQLPGTTGPSFGISVPP